MKKTHVLRVLHFVLRVGGQARKGELWEKEETRKEEKENRSFLLFLVEAARRAFPAEWPWSHYQLQMLWGLQEEILKALCMPTERAETVRWKVERKSQGTAPGFPSLQKMRGHLLCQLKRVILFSSKSNLKQEVIISRIRNESSIDCTKPIWKGQYYLYQWLNQPLSHYY